MSGSQYEIQAAIRRVLTRHWIDLDRVRFGAFRGVVRVSGELRAAVPSAPDPSASLLDVLRSEILRIRDVKGVAFDLDNWVRDGEGRLVPAERRVSLFGDDGARGEDVGTAGAATGESADG
ncbi:MAG: hypothetical protein IPM29_32270 [Planctomycetes bacterium]|nr:hypothetical protein [Planctomycetota bacterium]